MIQKRECERESIEKDKEYERERGVSRLEQKERERWRAEIKGMRKEKE